MSCCLVTSHGLFCYFKGPCYYVSHHPIFIQQRHKGDWSLFQLMLVERQGTLWTSGQVIPVHILVMCSLVQRNMESFAVSNYPSILPIWSEALWQKTYQGSPDIFLLSLAWQDRLFYLYLFYLACSWSAHTTTSGSFQQEEPHEFQLRSTSIFFIFKGYQEGAA